MNVQHWPLAAKLALAAALCAACMGLAYALVRFLLA